MFLSSCVKNDKFDYPMKTLHGIWDSTEILTDNGWLDITSDIYAKFQFSIRFNSDGTYYGSGAFGNGSGTYKAIGNTIITYIDGEEYARYIIKSLTDNKAELTMDMGGTSTIDVRVTKRQ